MTITAIEIKKVKGIDHKQFKLQLMPNKPNLLVAPNGFGKSSIATAFASMNSQKMTLADKDRYKEDTSHEPELSITANAQKLTANCNKNEIRAEFDVSVIRSGLVPKATKRNMGRFTQATASMEIEPIFIRRIPQKVGFTYRASAIRSAFGANGKVLPNITNWFQNPLLYEVISKNNLDKLTGKRIQDNIDLVVSKINQQNGTVDQIRRWITDNHLGDFRKISPLNEWSKRLLKINLATTETEAFLAAYQIAEVYKADHKSFIAALNWLQYTKQKKNYDELLQSFCSSNWQRARLNEDQKTKTLSVIFPQAHQLSNGQRDVVTLVIPMHKALYEGSKKPLILVIDEVFDYLDDANLVAFQYYVTSLIKEYKQQQQTIYPIILTHLDPGVFFDFCFNSHQIHTHYLQAKSSDKPNDMLKLIKIRELQDTEEGIKNDLNKYWFHYYPGIQNISSEKWPNGLRNEWRNSGDFRKYAINELNRYLQNQNYDPLAVCIAVRITIEKKVYDLFCSEDKKEEFLSTHKTKEKLNYAARHVVDIPEVYFLLGLIYNSNLHWKQGKDFVSPLVARLNHPTIKHLIREGCKNSG